MVTPRMTNSPPGDPETGDWSQRSGKLSPDRADVPGENVEGRRPAGPVQGFGRMWQKTYAVALPETVVGPAELIATWKAEFSSFWPEGSRFHTPLVGIAPGEVAVIELGAGGATLSTGVVVIHSGQESFTLLTPQGHPLAGWITFSAFPESGTTVAQTQVLMRASDPLYELGMVFGGHRHEDRFWTTTLRRLAARWGIEAEPTVRSVCVDHRRQWRRAFNVRHNAAIRTAITRMTAPFRAILPRRDDDARRERR
jgi:hypothetical protein